MLEPPSAQMLGVVVRNFRLYYQCLEEQEAPVIIGAQDRRWWVKIAIGKCGRIRSTGKVA